MSQVKISPEPEQPASPHEGGLPTQPRIALCLSGGGFRATLFHLGVIRFLRDAGLLMHVRDICSVSGGSVLAAHVERNWGRYTSPDDVLFERAAKELIAFVKLDVRGRIVRRLPFGTFHKAWRRSALIRAMYDDLYRTVADEATSVTPPPNVHVLATNLTLGCNCSFESDRVVLFKKEGTLELPTETLRDSIKVTASSAFPAFFPPVSLTAEDLGVEKDKYLPEIQFYTDGGVYDNLGIRRLQFLTADSDHDPARQLTLLLVSDAGRPFALDLTRTMPGIIRTAWRANDIALFRIGELDQRELRGAFDPPAIAGSPAVPSRLRFLSISDEVPWEPGGNALPSNIQRLVKTIRTDLDAFSDREIVFLVQHGYSVARRAFGTLYDDTRNDLASPLALLAEEAAKVPSGRWLPPDTEPGWPRDKDVTVWETDTDKSLLQLCTTELQRSGDLQMRMFRWRDPVSLCSLACLVVLLGFSCFFLLKVLGPVEPIPAIVFSNFGDSRDRALFPVDVSMPGIRVTERRVTIDLRNEVKVPEQYRDVLRLSPSVHTYAVSGVRNSTDARYLVYEFSSQRRLMDVACASHPYQLRYRRDKRPGGDGFDNVYTVVLDINQHSPDIPFAVTFRATRWNAYQADNNNYVGALVSGDEDKIVLRVFLPEGRIYRGAKLHERRQEVGVPWTDTRPEDGSPPVPDDDKKGITWTMLKPRKGWAHRAMIDWQ